MKYYNLVFEGGGVKGIAYVGALKALSEMKDSEKGKELIVSSEVKRVAGASARAITALLVGLNYNTIDEINEEFRAINFNDFADSPTKIERWKSLWAGDLQNYKYNGKKFLNGIREKIYKKVNKDPSITFLELRKLGEFKDIYIIGTNLRGLLKLLVITLSLKHKTNKNLMR